MGGLKLALVSLALGVAQDARVPASVPDWSAAWDDLAALLEAPEAPTASTIRARLTEVVSLQPAAPRARLLAAWLNRSAGREGRARLSTVEVAELKPSEVWLAARVVDGQAARDRALVLSLEGLESPELDLCFQEAFGHFVQLSQAYELERAEQIARAMHARAQAAWSAANLANTLRRAGRYEQAYELLGERLASRPSEAQVTVIHQDRSLVDTGAGWVARARDDLGAALTRGSTNAAVVLARTALARGRPGRSRALFRSVLREDPPAPWALRGWGLSMLPSHRSRL